MYRRRRPQREKITFGFDSFLDVVANVIGVIIRLILVTWVGARSYNATMHWIDQDPPPAPKVALEPLAAPKVQEDPVNQELEKARKEIDRVRGRLLEQLQQLELVQGKEAHARKDLTLLASRRQDLDREKQVVGNLLQKRDLQVQYAALSLEELRAQGKKLEEEVKKLEKVPTPTKPLHYHVPVSRPVRSDEVFFECKAGKITYIDLAAFRHDMQNSIRGKVEQLQTQWEVTATTTPVGAFRMRYVIERVRDFTDNLASGNTPPRNTSFDYGLSGWVLEPISENRGEPVEVALSGKSQFRQIIEGLDAQQSVVTLWVYPDSFGLFRQVRDFLYERDIEVAGRPLPVGAPIAASRFGTASRGQ
jgi:hypothetical protein